MQNEFVWNKEVLSQLTIPSSKYNMVGRSGYFRHYGIFCQMYRNKMLLYISMTRVYNIIENGDHFRPQYVKGSYPVAAETKMNPEWSFSRGRLLLTFK